MLAEYHFAVAQSDGLLQVDEFFCRVASLFHNLGLDLFRRGGVEAVVGEADRDGAPDDVAEGDGEEVAEELGHGDIGAFKHPCRDEEHVGDAVFIAQGDECADRNPACKEFGGKGVDHKADPHGHAHAPVGGYSFENHGEQRQLHFRLRYAYDGRAVGLRGGKAGPVDKQIGECECTDEVENPHQCPVPHYGSEPETARGAAWDEDGVIAGEQFGSEQDDEKQSHRECQCTEKFLYGRIAGRYGGEAVACGDRKDAAERYERTGHDR